MILTENINLSDSVLFLVAARVALSNIVEESSIEDKDYVKSFLVNEASDYQIMSLLVREDLPEEKFDEVDELLLFSELKELVVSNYGLVSEFIEPDIIQNFIFEVSSIYPDFSSAYPILEFHAGVEKDAEEIYLDEIYKIILSEDFEFVDERGFRRKMTPAEREAARKSAEKAKEFAGKAVGKGKEYLKTAGKFYAKKGKQVGAAIKKVPGKIATDIKRGVAGVKQRQAAAKTARGLATGKLGGPGPVVPTGKGVMPADRPPAGLLTRIKQSVGSGAAAAGKAISAFAKTPAGQAVGGAALAALALYGSYKVYKRFLSKAARACKGMGGAEKTACMKKYKLGAVKAQIGDLQKAASACAKAKNPAKCKAGIQRKIGSLKVKAAKAQR